MTTERRNPRSVDIDLFPTERILKIINGEEALVAGAVAAAIPDIASVVDLAVESLKGGGHLIYVGTGTSGRIAVLDSVECPPTFGSPPDWIQAVVAGGTKALAQGAEGSGGGRAKAASGFKSEEGGRGGLGIGIASHGTQ